MKISTIMACYNSAATIGTAIESFLAQDHADKELIVIDGASRDRTCEIVRSFDSPQITLVSEPDAGLYDAINKGVMRATADLVGLLHSDDRLAHPGVLSLIADQFAASELDAVYADAAYFRAEAPDKLIRTYRSSYFRPDRLGWGWMPAHTTLFLRKEVFVRYGMYKVDYRIAADFEYVARIFHSGGLRAVYIPQVLVHMQDGGLSTGGLGAKLTINREVIRACRENGIATNYLKILSKYPRKVMEYVYRQ